MRKRHILIPLFLYLCLPAFGLASSREEAIASLRPRLREFGRLEILVRQEREAGGITKETGDGWGKGFYSLQKEPFGLLLPAIDACILGGNLEEFVGATGIYSALLYDRKIPANPAYKSILLNLLAKDDLQSADYTRSIVATLRLYPSRETVVAYMDLAHRVPTKEMRVHYVDTTSAMVGIWLGIFTNSTEAQVDKALADFEAWFAKNKDRIHFTKDGRLKLSGGKAPEEEKTVLDAQDRALIRDNAECVLRLMSYTMSDAVDEELSNAKAPALNAQCGPALFGAERSALLGMMGETVAAGGDPAPGMYAELQGSPGYPTADAALLAAIYGASYGKDPEAIHLAEETLVRASRADIRRVAKGVPASVRKKAESLAGKQD